MKYVEKPPHIHPTRIRHIPDHELLAALEPTASSLTEWRTKLLRDRRPVWDIARWAAGVRGTSAAQEAIAAADAVCDRQVDFTDPAHGRSQLYGFHYLGWMTPLVSAYELTGDPRYARAWDRLFGQWYDSRDNVVGEWPGLDVIWYSLGVCGRSAVIMPALAAFADEPALSQPRWEQMLKTVLGGARWAFEEHEEFRHGNWQLACCAELLHVAGVLTEFTEAGQWARVAQDRLLEHLELDVYPDGGHYERSPGYHAMCLNALQRAAVVGEQCLNWTALTEHPRFRAMHDWLIALADPSGWVPALQDSGIVWPATALLRGHYLLGDPAYRDFAARWLGPRLAEELAWLPPHRTDSPAGERSGGSQRLDSSQYAVFRSGWSREDLLTIINYGPYIGHELEPHSHHAALDFVISGWGVPLAWEAGGPPSYDDPGYYDWFQATVGHNTVMATGDEFTEDRRARLTEFLTHPEIDVFAGEHHGYQQVHRRRITFIRAEPRFWLVTDRLAVPATWLLHGTGPWLPCGAGYAPAAGPGLLVLPVRPDRLTGVRTSSGPSRIPDPATGTAEFGTVHTLGLQQDRGDFDVVLVPFADTPPEVGIRTTEDAIEVTIGSTVDLIAADHWSRSTGARVAWSGIHD